VETLVQLTGVAQPAAAPACVCRLHTVAVRQAALVSDESALEACLRRCAIQIDDLSGGAGKCPLLSPLLGRHESAAAATSL